MKFKDYPEIVHGESYHTGKGAFLEALREHYDEESAFLEFEYEDALQENNLGRACEIQGNIMNMRTAYSLALEAKPPSVWFNIVDEPLIPAERGIIMASIPKHRCSLVTTSLVLKEMEPRLQEACVGSAFLEQGMLWSKQLQVLSALPEQSDDDKAEIEILKECIELLARNYADRIQMIRDDLLCTEDDTIC